VQKKNKAMIVFYRNDKNEDIFLKEATPSFLVCLLLVFLTRDKKEQKGEFPY